MTIFLPERRRLWVPGDLNPKPRILMLFCGGTIAMRRNAKGALEPALSPEQLYALAPKIRDHVDLDIMNITDKDSSALTLWHRKRMISEIRKNMHKYDGIVITHGTDTMATTASTLAFHLGGDLRIPVVITGSQMAPEELGCDATPNLERAIRAVITAPQPGVFLAFHDHVHGGSVSMKRSESALDAFDSPANRPAATLTAHGLDWDPMMLKKLELAPGPSLPYGNSRVSTIFLEGDLHDNEVKRMLKRDVTDETRGIVVLAPGTGNLSKSHLKILKGGLRRGISIVVGPQITGGKIQMNAYELGREAAAAGLIPANDMTPQATKAKLIWALGMADALVKKGVLKEKDRHSFIDDIFKHVRAGEMSFPHGQESEPLPEIVSQLVRPVPRHLSKAA